MLSNFVVVQIHYTYFLRRAVVNVDSIVLRKARAKCGVFSQIGLPSTVYVFRVSHKIYFQLERTLDCLASVNFLKQWNIGRISWNFINPFIFWGKLHIIKLCHSYTVFFWNAILEPKYSPLYKACLVQRFLAQAWTSVKACLHDPYIKSTIKVEPHVRQGIICKDWSSGLEVTWIQPRSFLKSELFI